MHPHGLDRLVVAKVGCPLPAPDRADTVLVGPGERDAGLVRADLRGVGPGPAASSATPRNVTGLVGTVTAMVVQG
jgi:hypothetical protein